MVTGKDRPPKGKSIERLASRLFGRLKHRGPAVTLEEMDRAIVEGASEAR